MIGEFAMKHCDRKPNTICEQKIDVNHVNILRRKSPYQEYTLYS